MPSEEGSGSTLAGAARDGNGPPSSDPFGTGVDSNDSFDDLLRRVARAPAVRPEDLATSAARGDLVGRTVGRFRVLERLGAGGMGVVYGAEDTQLGRTVALKVLVPTASDTLALDLLLREARAAAAINHPSVAAVYEAGEAGGIAFIAMEYVDGVTLRSRMARGPLPIAEVLRYGQQIAEGLAKAHASGVVHRDLKPDNVMIDRDDRIKILDFGLARPAWDEVAPRSGGGRGGQLKGVVAGTPMYMSPEQAHGEPVDARCDVFSFGVVLYEMLTGKGPFSVRGLLPAYWRFEPDAPVTLLREETPRSLAGVIDRCLMPRPAQRYAGGAALARAFHSLVSAPKKGADRSRLPMLAGVALGIGASLGAAIALKGTWHGERKARLAPPAAPAARPTLPRLSRLTANVPENPVLSAALSPDGETLAYIDKTGLSLEQIGGAAERVVLAVTGTPQSVSWFPDGTRLAVCTALKGAEEEVIWEVSRFGTAPPRRLARGPFTGLAVSPDGRRIAFAANDSVGWFSTGEAGTEPAERGESGVLRRLVRKNEGCFITDVAWSPDGARIAYASLCFDSLAGTAIETVPVAGGPSSVVVADPHLYNSFVRAGVIWSSAGEIVYPRAEWLPAEAGSNLWSVSVDLASGAPTSEPRELTSWVGVGAAALTASASGQRIAFIRFEAQTDVYVGALTNGGRALSTPERLTMTDRNERPSTWSRDGRGVYFFSDRSGNFDIFFQALDGSSARPVATGPEWETLSQMSPDGESLLYWRFPAVVSGEAVRPELVRRQLLSGGGGAATPILSAVTLAHPAGAGRPAPWEERLRCPKLAGAACVLSEKLDDNHLVFSTLDPVLGRGAEIFRINHPTAASNIWDVSPDGSLLAIPTADGPISIQPIRGASAGRTTLRVPGCDPVTPAWSADGRGLFVSVDCEADAPPFRLYYLGLDGSVSLLWQAPPLYILESEPSPDGKRLAIAVKHKDDDVWMIDGLR